MFDSQEYERDALPNLRCWLTTSSDVISMSKFFKDHKTLHEPKGQVQFVVFKKFVSAYLFQIA